MKSSSKHNWNDRHQIILWLQNHDLIKVKALEEKCGMPQACIAKVIAGKVELPEKHIPALCKELKAYGFRLK